MGTLFVVATPIGNLNDFSKRAEETLRQSNLILVEDTRQTIKLLNHFDIKNKMITYAGVYRKGSASQTRSDWIDEWYEGCGLTQEEYDILYKKMLKQYIEDLLSI